MTNSVKPISSVEQRAHLPTSFIFVDGTNLERRCEQAFNRTDIDFGKFFARLAEGTNLLQTYYFTAPYNHQINRDRFNRQRETLSRLRRMRNVVVRLGRHEKRQMHCGKCGQRRDEFIEKGTDVGTACEFVRAACMKRAERLILVSGDNDFLPALVTAKNGGVHAEIAFVIGPDEDVNRKWQEVADMRAVTRKQIALDHAFMPNCWHRKDL